MRANIVFLVVAILAAVSLSQSRAQQKSSAAENKQGNAASQKNSVGKTLLDLTARIDELKERIRTLETEQGELRARLVQAERSQLLPNNLREVDLELARFDCTEDQNRAWAMALERHEPGYTFEGAAAMNCTQRLAKITEKAVHSLENR